MISVPDMMTLSEILIDPTINESTRETVMATIFGGQKHKFDYHKTGFYFEYLNKLLLQFHFCNVINMKDGFGLFEDSSDLILAVSAVI